MARRRCKPRGELAAREQHSYRKETKVKSPNTQHILQHRRALDGRRPYRGGRGVCIADVLHTSPSVPPNSTYSCSDAHERKPTWGTRKRSLECRAVQLIRSETRYIRSDVKDQRRYFKQLLGGTLCAQKAKYLARGISSRSPSKKISMPFG